MAGQGLDPSNASQSSLDLDTRAMEEHDEQDINDGNFRRQGKGTDLPPQQNHEARASGAESFAQPPSIPHSDNISFELEPMKSSAGLKQAGVEKSMDNKKSAADAVESLPNYSQWTKKQSRSLSSGTKDLYQIFRRKVLRIYEIPPSKDGRCIPFNHNGRLIDKRTGHYYVNNTIRSSRYTLWTFLPRQLIAQFSKLANFYFLCVSILQMIPTLSTTGTYTTIAPLIFFITLSISKEGYDDYRRYKLDRVENNREVEVLCAQESNFNGEVTRSGTWTIKKWKDLRVGDVVKLNRDDWVPADILLMTSEGLNGATYIDTAALDGESNLKIKQSTPMIAEACSSIEKLLNCDGEVVVEDPNLDLFNFEGKVTISCETKPLTNSHIIYRGSIVRNTHSCIGLVVFSGEESKIRMNANKNPRTKAPMLQALVNRIVIIIVIFVISLSVFNTVAYRVWINTTEKRSWNLQNSSVPFFAIFAGFIIMFNTLIPLSLYVSLEIVKLAQIFFLNDIDMYHKETNTPLEARTSTINEDLGQVSFIFSDKTGTLTDNSLLFRKLSVNGTAWIHDFDTRSTEAGESPIVHHKRRNAEPNKSMSTEKWPLKVDSLAPSQEPETHAPAQAPEVPRRRSIQWRSSTLPSRPQTQLSTIELLQYLKDHPHTAFSRKVRFFLLSIALCHMCLPEKDQDGEVSFQAASPDELALVKAARELGYAVTDRDFSSIYVRTYPNGFDGLSVIDRYEILDVIEFSSSRKRMSIIVRLPNGKVCIFCKGADTTIMQKLRLSSMATQQAEEVERRVSLRRSMEAQEVMRRNSTQRLSIGGPSRNSLHMSRLQPIRNGINEWLRAREEDVDHSSNMLTPRLSMQHTQNNTPETVRNSIAFGEKPKPPIEQTTNLVNDNLLDEERVFARCFGHINDFASEGLRTLLYGYRYIDEQEYTVWRKVYCEATTSLVNRQELIERAAEMIERDFELGGGTAVEDKLQKGVPETIEKLRRAGIKLWMLTGDKRETAINIGYSCHLIKDYSVLTILDKNENDVGRQMAAAKLEIDGGMIAHSVLVIDGATLTDIEAEKGLKTLFFDLSIIADAVICCRASPSQKASLVKVVRKMVDKSVTLAIGDGANDIAMIQEAHVGIGITGKEGLQAARVSDYSIAQFRFLSKLLLVHGRWNYVRTCKYIAGTFWKELLFYLTQALYQRYNGYTGTSLYEPWSLRLTINDGVVMKLFTSLPVIFIGIFEKDLSASTLLAVPELYHRGQRGEGFNFKVYFWWMFLASSQAMITYFMAYTLYASSIIVKDGGVFAMGVLTYSVVVTLISSKLQLVEMHNKTFLALISFVLSVGGWFAWNIIFSVVYRDNVLYNVRGGFLTRFGPDPAWWMVYIATVAACILFDITLTTLRVAFWPTDVDTFQEFEKIPELRKQFEEAAAMELQQGWNCREKKSKGKEKMSKSESESTQHIMERGCGTGEEGRL